jgi:polyferredoxin
MPMPAVGQRLLAGLRWLSLASVGLLLALEAVHDFTAWEPFPAFQPSHASPWILALAGTSLALSLLTPRPWCRFACPTGALLELLRRKQ